MTSPPKIFGSLNPLAHPYCLSTLAIVPPLSADVNYGWNMEPFIPLTLPSFLSFSRRLRPRRRHLQITVAVVSRFVAVAPLVTPARDGEEVRHRVTAVRRKRKRATFLRARSISVYSDCGASGWGDCGRRSPQRNIFALNTPALAAANCYTSHSAGNILLPAPISAMEKWELSQMKREEKRAVMTNAPPLAKFAWNAGSELRKRRS